MLIALDSTKILCFNLQGTHDMHSTILAPRCIQYLPASARDVLLWAGVWIKDTLGLRFFDLSMCILSVCVCSWAAD